MFETFFFHEHEFRKAKIYNSSNQKLKAKRQNSVNVLTYIVFWENHFFEKISTFNIRFMKVER